MLYTFSAQIASLILFTSATSIVWGQPSAGQSTQFELLYSFSGTDGANPVGPPAIAPNGSLFGATSNGGKSQSGTVFELTPPAQPGGSWTESVLYSFQSAPDGASPTGVILSKSGALFGTTRSGGVNNAGAVFELTPPAQVGGTWSESIIHSFGSGADGSSPYAGLTFRTNGILFGTTLEGGTQGTGTAFELTPPVRGGLWSEQVIHNFTGSENPLAPLKLTRNGDLVGTGSGNAFPSIPSSAFALIPPAVVGGQWTKATLYDFPGTTQAESPLAVGGTALFGTTINGGADLAGTVYELKAPAVPGGMWTQAVLYTFPVDNGGPTGKLVFGANNVLFGSTSGNPNTPQAGSVFALAPPAMQGGSWTFTLLHSLNGATDGSNPTGGLSRDAAGTLFGFTHFGGPNGQGTVFAVVPAL